MGLLPGSREQRTREARAEFLESPVGRARTAFERGDLVLQLDLDPANQRPAVIPTSGSQAPKTSSDPNEILNAVCREGWDLITASLFPADHNQRRSTSGTPRGRDSAGGCYLFRRAPQHRTIRPAG